MKYLSFLFILATFQFSLIAGNNPIFDGFSIGNPDIKSINAISFGPEGILFIGDSQNGKIVAYDTKDTEKSAAPESLMFEKIDEYIANLIGTSPSSISIQDMAVNPISKKIYFAVQLENGDPVLFRTNGEKMEHLPLEQISFSKTDIQNIVAEDAKDSRGRELRQWTVSDMVYDNGSVMISGLSNEAFASTFRKIPFPFDDTQMHASLEIYHGAHGQYETHSPIKTFMPYKIAEKEYLVASYTCTPLVIFPMDEIKAGQHTKGKTVAELGNRNTPLDIISYKIDDKEYILLANSTRALMKLDPANIDSYDAYLTEPVENFSGTEGVEFAALPFVNVQQLDKYDDNNVVFLQRMSNGDLNLHTPNMRRL